MGCEKERRESLVLCHYIWYEDWKCTECCVGDRCNFYVTLGGSSTRGSLLLLLLPLAPRLLLHLLLPHHLLPISPLILPLTPLFKTSSSFVMEKRTDKVSHPHMLDSIEEYEVSSLLG